MSNPQVRREPPGTALEVVAIGVGAALAGVALVTWAGAWLAATVAGGTVSGGMTEWVVVAVRLARNPGDPATAWANNAEGLPSPGLYWGATALVAAVVVGGAVGVAMLWRRWSSSSLRRFGTESDAHPAIRRDVQPLIVDSTIPPTGRLLLGRLAGRRVLLATEDAHRHPRRGRVAQRQGDRGSVALIGPTRSGKTVLASAGIVGWDGPVVALSIKRDLYDATAAARAKKGEIAVFDPGGVTGMPSARWSPLRDVATASAALRASRALAQAIPRIGVQSGDFWSKHGEAFCSAYMCLAGLAQLLPGPDGTPRAPLTMEQLASWAHLQVGIREPLINDLIRSGLGNDRLEVQLLARHAMVQLLALEREDPRIRASIYATARLAFEAWLEPSVAHSASNDARPRYDSNNPDRYQYQPRWVDLGWLMGTDDDSRANTLYLCAPDTEFQRLAPVIGGLLGDLREQIHAQDVRGDKLAKPMLVVIDEAGQLELQWLPAAVSTLAGLGVILVTCWQSRSQIADLYGTLADTVLTGHRSKVFFSGLDDPTSVDYLSKTAGAEHIPQRGWSAEVRGGPRTVSEHLQREELVPAHVPRQIRPQEAVLLHGTLPPIHLRAVRWWEDPKLRELVPTNDDGRPTPPNDIPTCPLTDEPAPPPSPVIDSKTVRGAEAQLPKPGQSLQGAGREVDRDPTAQYVYSADGSIEKLSRNRGNRGSQRLKPADGQAQLPLHPEGDDDVARNRVAGNCNRCSKWLKVGEGQVIPHGHKKIVICHPACSLMAQTRS